MAAGGDARHPPWPSPSVGRVSHRKARGCASSATGPPGVATPSAPPPSPSTRVRTARAWTSDHLLDCLDQELRRDFAHAALALARARRRQQVKDTPMHRRDCPGVCRPGRCRAGHVSPSSRDPAGPRLRRQASSRAGARPAGAVPAPGRLVMEIRPPSASTRSLMPTRPVPAATSAPPMPSSWTRRRRVPPVDSVLMVTVDAASAWRRWSWLRRRCSTRWPRRAGAAARRPRVRGRRGSRSGARAPSRRAVARPRPGSADGCPAPVCAVRPARPSIRRRSGRALLASSAVVGRHA